MLGVGIVNTLAVVDEVLANLRNQHIISLLGQQRVNTLLVAGREVEAPFLESVGDSVEAILLTVHKEDFSLEVDTNNPALVWSLYMK